MTMAISTHVILTMNAGFASLAVASLANSTAPDAALTANAIQMTLKNASRGASGRRLAKPRIRRSIATLGPAENAIPSVCKNSSVGYPQIDGDSFNQIDHELLSSDCSQPIMCASLVIQRVYQVRDSTRHQHRRRNNETDREPEGHPQNAFPMNGSICPQNSTATHRKR